MNGDRNENCDKKSKCNRLEFRKWIYLANERDYPFRVFDLTHDAALEITLDIHEKNYEIFCDTHDQGFAVNCIDSK